MNLIKIEVWVMTDMLITIIKKFWFKIRLSFYVNSINNYLSNREINIQSFFYDLDILKKQRKLISDNQIFGLKEKYFEEYDYFKNGHVYIIGKKADKFLDTRNKSIFLQFDELNELQSKYLKIGSEFIKNIDNLNFTCKKLNVDIRKHENSAELFLQVIYKIRYKENELSIIEELKNNFKDAYLYLVNGTSKNEIFTSFEHYYTNLESYIKKWNEIYKILKKANKFLSIIEEARKDYIIYNYLEWTKKEYKEVYDFLNHNSNIESYEYLINKFKNYYKDLDEYIKKWNKEYIENELKNNDTFFSNISGLSLDNQQRLAIVTDESSNLVLAGAGSGKTLTISAKVKYLVEKKGITPKDILLISFTTKAAGEMSKRISKKLNINIQATTFHSLGLKIISKERTKKPDIFMDIEAIISKYFKNEVYKDKLQIQKLIEFFGYYINIPKNWEDFNSLGEYHDHYRDIDFQTIKTKVKKPEYIHKKTKELKENLETLYGETVKSLEELIIANFLYLNGVNYIYECPYKHATANEARRQYKPDFYLPDYDIYLEHFGINKNMKTPWLSEIEEIKYLDGIQWKRRLHEDHDTTLIETYSYYNKEGNLLDKLEEKLKNHGVEFKDIEYEEVFNRIYDNTNDKYLEEFKKLVKNFIGLFKSNGFDKNKFDEFKTNNIFNCNTFLKKRTNLFVDVVKPIYNYYQDYLSETTNIDFNDMINLATEVVKNQSIDFKYKYIIIDEYQDISVSRFNLVKAIKDITGARLMCVGDDWQSIYRFTGSDIKLFTDFSKLLGHYELLKIEKTYRNSQELIDIAGKFIMKNANQLIKNLKSDKHNSNPIRILGYENDIFEALIKSIDEIVYLFGENAEIMILGRNNHDINFIDKHCDFELYDNKKNKIKKINYKKHPELNMFYFTAHKSKGLEADNVIIINAANKLLGFPNKISDDPVLSLVLTDLDSYPFAEERRLFYVALTRTKNNTYILAPDKKMSPFVEELIKNYNLKYDFLTTQKPIIDNPNCPKCKKGYLVLRKGNFLGCSNYPMCDYTVNHIEILNEQIKCLSCGGYMVKRPGPYGEFYGCTNYPFCTNTINIESA